MNEMDGRDIIADSRFQFWTNKDDYLMPDADNVCIVTSSSPDIWAEAKPDSNGKYTRLSAFCRSGHYGTTTLTFTLGNYVRACKLTVFKDPGIQWDKISDEELVNLINKNFDLRPAGIIKMLDLRRPIYKQTAAYGHFGRNDLDLPWEKLDKVDVLKKYL